MTAVSMLGHFTDRVARALSDVPSAGSKAAKAAKVSYAGGDTYEGEAYGSAAQPVRHGYGVYRYAAGQGRYEGEFLEDEKHGRGTLFYEDGDAYDGQWLNGQQHGHGVYVHWSPKGGIWVYDGEFREGERAGSGALVARERGSLAGTWTGGRLSRGVELRAPFPGPGDCGLEVSVLGAFLPEEARPEGEVAGAEAGEGEVEAAEDEEEEEEDEDAGEEEEEVPELPLPRTAMGSSPRDWRAAEVRLWLRALGLEEAPERASLSLGGAQLLGLTDLEALISQFQVDAGVSELAQSWRSTLRAAHASLCRAASDAEGLVGTWEELQAVAPSIRKRIIPASELRAAPLPSSGAPPLPAAARHERRGMPVELCPVPLHLLAGQGSDAAPGGSEPSAAAGERACAASARAWARDLEALATLRHPSLRTLLGVALAPAEAEGPAIPTLVYEASRAGGRLLFEWIHASLPDGSRPQLDFRSQLRISIGVCEALAAMAQRSIAYGALCSVNVELIQSGGGELSARLMRSGVTWWRWGWRGSLRVREAGQPRRRALSVEEVMRRYSTCPVNWLAPEVLRGREPNEASDVYSFGLVLWEMLYRAVPFGDFSIAQIIATVGYGRRQLRAAASPGSSIETSFLHEVMNRCAKPDPAQRPSYAVLLDSLKEMLLAYEKRKSRKSVLGMMGKKTEALLASAAHQRDLLIAASGGQPPLPAAAASSRQAEPEEARMVRLATGEWVRVDADLVEQFPGDEEKWRALMAFRARLSASE